MVVFYRTAETTAERSYLASRSQSASCSSGGRLPIAVWIRRVLNHATYSTIASSSWVLVRQTRSLIAGGLS